MFNFWIFFYIYSFIVGVGGVGVGHGVGMEVRGQKQELFLSFQFSPGDQTQVLRLNNKVFYPLSHLNSLRQGA